jgi:peptide/nickel transport system substrate-binding protein
VNHRLRRALLALVLTVTAGCARVGAGGGEAGGNPWTHHGVLRIVDLAEPDNLNPVVGNQQIDSDLTMFWGGFFYEYSDRNELVPDLATDVPTLANGGISRDGTTIVYHLRSGVKWHDGAPFDADDVIFTWHAILNKNNNIPSTAGYDFVSAIDKRGPYEIAVHLKHPYAPFVDTFFTQSANPYPILPKHVLGSLANINDAPFNSQPIGTGPFVVEHWQRGSKIVFDANPNYWRGAPKLKRIEYTPVPNENTIITLLQSHDADLEYNGAVANYPTLKGIPGTTLTLTPFDVYDELALNTTVPNLADVRVRRALQYATNYPELVRDITYGVDVPADSDQPSDSWAHDATVTKYSFDPGKARALLDRAGWTVGPDGIRTKGGQRLTITLATNVGSATGYKASVVIQRFWRDVGIDAQVKTYITSKFFATYGAGGIVQRGDFDVAFFGWISGIDPDDSVLFESDQFPPAGQNVYHLSDPALDAAMHVQLTNSDRAARKKAFDTIQERLALDVPMLVLWFGRRISVYNTDLKNYRPAHYVTSWWNPWEWEI